MKQVTKKLGAIMLCAMMTLVVMAAGQVKAETNSTESVTTIEEGTSEIVTIKEPVETTVSEETVAIETTKPVIGSVTVTVEKFTIGQGYVVQPTKVRLREGDTAATVFETVMRINSYKYDAGIGENGFYVNSINDADTKKINIPTEISSMPKIGLEAAPSNKSNAGNKLPNNALGTGSYSETAGWMLAVNNKFPTESADQIKLNNGDVVRWQFSVYGYGADLGKDTSGETSIPKKVLANRDALFKEMAEVNAKYYDYIKLTDFKKTYNKIITTSSKYNASQTEINTALADLKKIEKNPVTTAKATTKVTTKAPETTTSPSVKRATIKSVKNVKTYKAKIRIKRIPKVLGYQYKYADNKEFKKAKTKTTKLTTITTKKFKKNQKCYVMVRAYVEVNKKKVYGKWSKKKSVKIKK